MGIFHALPTHLLSNNAISFVGYKTYKHEIRVDCKIKLQMRIVFIHSEIISILLLLYNKECKKCQVKLEYFENTSRPTLYSKFFLFYIYIYWFKYLYNNTYWYEHYINDLNGISPYIWVVLFFLHYYMYMCIMCIYKYMWFSYFRLFMFLKHFNIFSKY